MTNRSNIVEAFVFGSIGAIGRYSFPETYSRHQILALVLIALMFEGARRLFTGPRRTLHSLTLNIAAAAIGVIAVRLLLEGWPQKLAIARFF